MDFFSSLPSPSSYLMASGVLEQITKKCLQVRDPIENNQNLLLPLLSMVGFLTKITEISPVETRDSFMSIVKSTEIFGTITMMYHSMSLGECLSFSFSLFPITFVALRSVVVGTTENQPRAVKRKKVLIERHNKPLKPI
jgi:hypothetical protein